MVARIDVILLFPYRMTSILFTAVYIRPHGGDPNTEHGSCTQHARRGGKKKIKVDVGNTCLNPEVMEKPIETLLSTLTKLEISSIYRHLGCQRPRADIALCSSAGS
jgi:hypothetical protein